MRSRLPSNRLQAARRRATRSSCAGCLHEIRLGYLGVNDDRRARFLDEGDLPDAKRADQLLWNHAQRSRRWSIAGCWLRIRVDAAVWKVTLPSTFCRTWWIWPFKT